VIRLEDGETSLLAGLLKVDKVKSESTVPFLGEIPLLGKLFSNNSSSQRTTDLVLTLTPHIVRFPDIKEEDLAPVWVGTESRISFFGSSSPRVQSGRAPRGPFDADNKEVDRGPSERPRPTLPQPAGGERSPTSPYGIRPRPQSGRELIPGGASGAKSLGVDEGQSPWADPGSGAVVPDQATDRGKPDSTSALLALGVEPSVVSISNGQERTLRLVGAGGGSAYRVPVALSFDPDRVAVVAVEPASGVVIYDQRIEAELGWLGLELVVVESTPMARPLAAVTVRGVAPGAAPVTLASEGARDADGAVVPVSVSDATVFVLDTAEAVGGF
jgi:general secretion pathway protein D